MSAGALTDALRETLEYFDPMGTPSTTNEVADTLDIGRRSTYERLDRLVERGHLETKKVGASARVWWRSPSRTASEQSSIRHDAIEPLLGDVLEDVDVGVFVLDGDFRVSWINDAAERYFGVDREEVLGRNKRELVEERTAPAIADSDAFADRVLATYADNTYPERFECRVTPEEGREARWLEHRSEPIASGALAGGRIELYYDVTERRESERRLEREREALDEVLETSPVGIAIFSSDGSLERANDRMAGLFGTTEEELADLSPGQRTLVAEDGTVLPFQERPVGRVFETGEPVYERELRIQDQDGRRHWVSINAVPFSEDEDLDRVVAVAADVTQLKEQSRQLERQRDDLESELDDVFDRISDGFYGLDEQLRFTYLNDRAETILDLEESSVVGRDIRDELPTDEGFESVLLEALEEQHPVFFEDYSEPLDTWFVNAIYPSESGLSVYFRDVTDRKEREQELERYAGIIDAVGEPVYELDERGRITFVNEPFVELMGYETSELIGEHVSDGIPAETFDRIESKLAELHADGGTGSASLEYEVETKDGERLPVENRFTVLTDVEGKIRGSAGVLRDITDRRERARELEESERRYRTLVENVPNGAVVLFDEEIRYVTAGGETFDRFGLSVDELVGSRPDEVLPAEFAEQLLPHYRATIEDEERRTFEVEHDDRHLQLRSVPVRDDDGAVFAGMAIAHDVTRRIERERELRRQREEVAALNNLNDISRRITDAVIEQSTREEIESTVCERLAETDSYELAWIGGVDADSRTVTMRTEAGVEGYLDDVTISVDPDNQRSEGPTGRALRTGELQVTTDVRADPQYAPWRGMVDRHEFRSSAAVPITHEDSQYGVLNVYARRPNAFQSHEREVISQLGEVVGHAIAAAERKRALLSDDVVELEFRVSDVYEPFDVDPDGRIVFEQAIPVADGEFVVYGRAAESAVGALEALEESRSNWSSVTVHGNDGHVRFKLRLEASPLLSRLTSVGGTFADAVIEDGDFNLTLQVPPSVDVRRMTDAVRETYPSAWLLRRRQRSRYDEPADHEQSVPTAGLTDRQRVALEAAYYEGYFEWPRNRSGADVASLLGVSPPTFHQHLRKAEREVFDSLFGPADHVE